MHKLLSLAVVLWLACTAGAQDETASTRLDKQFQELERRFSSVRTDIEYEHVGDCKRIVRELLGAIDSEADAELFVRKASAAISNGNEFRLFEFHLLWLGNDVLVAHPPSEMGFWDALVRKTSTCCKPDSDAESQNEFASIGTSLLTTCLPYTGRRLFQQDGAIDCSAWKEFEMWYSLNRKKFRYSAVDKKFTL